MFLATPLLSASAHVTASEAEWKFIEWRLSDPYGYPEDIIATDGQVIFGTRAGISRLDPDRNILTVWHTGPVEGRIAYAGGIVWAKSGATVQRLDMGSNSVTEWTSTIFERTGLILARDETLWFLSATVIASLDGRTNELITWQRPIIGMPSGIAMDGRGNLWFTSNDAHRVARLSPENGELAQWFLPPVGYWPEAVIIGPEGAVWFVAHRRPTLLPIGIYKLSPAEGELSFWIVPRLSTGIFSRLAASALGEVWLTIPFGGGIARLRPTDNVTVEKVKVAFETVGHTKMIIAPTTREVTLTATSITPRLVPAETTRDDWLAEWLPPRGKLFGDERQRDVRSRPSGIAIDAKGDIWFTDRDTNKVSKLTTRTPEESSSQVGGIGLSLALLVPVLALILFAKKFHGSSSSSGHKPKP